MIQVETIVYLNRIEVETIIRMMRSGVDVEVLIPAIVAKNNYQLYLKEHPNATLNDFLEFLQQPAIEAAIRVDEHITASQAVIDYINDKLQQLLNEPEEIQQFDSYLEFPNLGKVNTLYIDNAENQSYRWDDNDLKYYKINEIEIINGGN